MYGNNHLMLIKATTNEAKLIIKNFNFSRSFFAPKDLMRREIGMGLPSNKASTLVPNACASAGRVVTSGKPSPFSHLEIVLELTPIISPKTTW